MRGKGGGGLRGAPPTLVTLPLCRLAALPPPADTLPYLKLIMLFSTAPLMPPPCHPHASPMSPLRLPLGMVSSLEREGEAGGANAIGMMSSLGCVSLKVGR